MPIENEITPHEKQKIWRMKQMHIFYGSGRPIFKITKDNIFERKGYDVNYYRESNNWRILDNRNFIGHNKINLNKKLNLSIQQ